jgi:hypothetical protein
MVGTAYNHTCTASGSTPITFTVSAGDLPAGLSLGMGGVINGTPDATGTFSGTLTASNGTLPDATQGFSITIAPAPVAPQFTSAAPPSSGMVGTAYNHTCTASGSMPITFTVSAGALPAGLSLGMGGVINGTPDAAGTFSGTLTASNGTLPDATQNFTISISEYHTLVAGGTHGTVTGGGSYLHGASAIITATGNPGYLFADWGGDASGSTNPLSVVMNANKTITANFIPDTNDHDGDGLTNYQEIVDYHSDPQLADTDGDGFPDGYEASLGFSPTSAESTPDAQMEALIAVEVRFSAALGQSYRIESSTDMENWTQVEAGIPGTGGRETRFYSIQSVPKRFFRAIRE